MIKSIQDYSYKINESIGKGYSSTVHKGKNDSTGQDVSIKVIQMSKLQDPINQVLLQYEITALKSLKTSTNVLHLNDVYATKNNTYIVTELMQGDLHTLLKQRKQFPYYEAVEIIKQIITGYMDVYRAGYLHRDIKPANIFYKNGVYKIGDFGFAIPANDAHQHRNYNVGSPVYMPPEALKDNIYTHSCDTWAIGVIFFQLLKGLAPWRSATEKKLYDKMMTEPLHQLTTGLPQVARTFLSKVMHLDQNQRMTPEELLTWPAKLFSVEIRSTVPGQSRPPLQKSPLQQAHLNRVDNLSDNQFVFCSRSKSYSGNQVPKYVSGLRINMNKVQSNNDQQQQPQQKTPLNVCLFPPTNSNNINQIQNYQSAKKATMGVWQKNSVIFCPLQIQQTLPQIKLNQPPSGNKTTCNSAQFYATSMLFYIKFIHRVIKFISTPTEIPLKDLQQSLTRTLFKEIQTIKKFTDPQNLQTFSQVTAWKEFITSKQGEEKLMKKLTLLTHKYKMFNVLPKDEFVLEVYREQLIDGIQKIYAYLQVESNYSDKTLISLDYLVSFYQVWDYREGKGGNFNFKEFLDVSRFDKMMEISPYNVRRQHFAQLKTKMKALELIDSTRGMVDSTRVMIDNVRGVGQVTVIPSMSQQNLMQLFQNKARYQRVTLRY